MPARAARGIFVTGTDTGVGKTLAACALLHALAARGLRAIGMKPVAAGAERRGSALVHEDVERLVAASNVRAPTEWLNVYCFEPPVAPHIAASGARVRMTLAPIENAYRALADRADIVVVEGAGGFRVPVNEREDTGDLAVLLQLPVVLVVGVRLGCLSHALLTAESIAARGLRLAGWIANHIDADMERAEDNVAALVQRFDAPCIARIPFQRAPQPSGIAHLFDIGSVLGEP